MHEAQSEDGKRHRHGGAAQRDLGTHLIGPLRREFQDGAARLLQCVEQIDVEGHVRDAQRGVNFFHRRAPHDLRPALRVLDVHPEHEFHHEVKDAAGELTPSGLRLMQDRPLDPARTNHAIHLHLEEPPDQIVEGYPDDQIQISSARDSVTVNGRVTDKATSDRVAALVASLAKTVVNNLTLSPNPVEKQILLRVKFAEIDRNMSKAFGINLISTGAGNTPGGISTGQFAPPRVSAVSGSIPGGANGTVTEFSLSDVLNVFAFRPDLNLAEPIKHF